MLARDAAAGGIEILLVQRSAKLRFMGGMHVFPGGAVHLDDADPAILSRIAVPARPWTGDDARASADRDSGSSPLPPNPSLAGSNAAQEIRDAATIDRAYALAAVRETCEEVALLLGIDGISPAELAHARHLLLGMTAGQPAEALGRGAGQATAGDIRKLDGAATAISTQAVAEAARSATAEEIVRSASAAGRDRPDAATMLRALEAIDARIDLSVVVPLSRWITPAGLPIRFDTRFYVARTPSNQDASVDGTECCASVWLSPSLAIAEHRGGRLALSPPTRVTLEEIAELSSVSHLLEYATSRPAPCIEHGGGRSNVES